MPPTFSSSRVPDALPSPPTPWRRGTAAANRHSPHFHNPFSKRDAIFCRGPTWTPGSEWLWGDWRCSCGKHNLKHRGFCYGHGCNFPRHPWYRAGTEWYCVCGNCNHEHRVVCNRDTCQGRRTTCEQLQQDPHTTQDREWREVTLLRTLPNPLPPPHNAPPSPNSRKQLYYGDPNPTLTTTFPVPQPQHKQHHRICSLVLLATHPST